MLFTEEQLERFAAPISTTEDIKCKNAINMIKSSLIKLGLTDSNLAAVPLFKDTNSYSIRMKSVIDNRDIKIFVQGSYANGTNIKENSDVDIAVVEEDVFSAEYRLGATMSDYGNIVMPARPKVFKDEVQECLESSFGEEFIERRNKSIYVYGNSYHQETDAVPSRRYKDYKQDTKNDRDNFIPGIVIIPDIGDPIVNYPEQHIINGKLKNVGTGFRYKKIVRIMKNINNLMREHAIESVSKVSSFRLESLLWNVPNENYNKYTSFGFILNEIISYLNTYTSVIGSFREANGIKPLCSSQSEINEFVDYLDDLKKFYNYNIGG